MQKPVKVCHLTSAHQWNDIRIFVKECSSLARNGFDVSLVAANCPSQTVNNVNIVGVQIQAKSRLHRMRQVAKAVYEAARQLDADVYHFHDPELLPYGLKLKKQGKTVIYDAHEDVPRQIMGKFWINKYLRRFVSRNFERYENRVSRKLSGIITATPYIAARFLKLNPRTTDINNFPLENELASETKWEEKQNQVCYIGGISGIRGNTQLVKAMEHTGNVKLVMAGNFSNQAYGQTLEQLPGWKNVDYKGTVDRKGVAGIMAGSKAGLVTFLPLPNHVDAQPNKMFEYMSAGIPVIGSHFPLWKDIIQGNDCGICVDPEKPEEIAAAIKTIFSDDEVAKKMGKNGRDAVMTRYNWGIEEKKLLAFYRGLLPS